MQRAPRTYDIGSSQSQDAHRFKTDPGRTPRYNGDLTCEVNAIGDFLGILPNLDSDEFRQYLNENQAE